ncbi:hypothetical protein CVU5213_08570 [Campylobacter vulpis]|uniref:Uncharacterized protein n=1 Tax=Campylobacter vulpis TaxID=1655500 RepID=A0ABS5P537_9BACT|nr:hypothetical protein [Campylobacter vulpis]MBS4236326.1 hypothetical protein [Campylobacter vulpis]MBS4241762.1 hypothetical protein [Campylobacter vulpis]MBS4269748.1 hypothetical protein [Campylobacter vulpis]
MYLLAPSFSPHAAPPCLTLPRRHTKGINLALLFAHTLKLNHASQAHPTHALAFCFFRHTSSSDLASLNSADKPQKSFHKAQTIA